jgi:hypothetical protein
MFADTLRNLYRGLEEHKILVGRSLVWKAIETHVRTEDRDNCLVNFPEGMKLFCLGGEIGISLRKVSPYAKVILTEHPVTMGHLTYIDEDDDASYNPHQYEREVEIAVPYALLESFSPETFEDWLLMKKVDKQSRDLREVERAIKNFVARHPAARRQVVSFLEGLE